MEGAGAIIAIAPGISGLVLLTANVWLRADWPYLTQLLIALATSMVLYLYFVLAELAGEAALAVEMAATLEDLALTIHPHPTMSETLMEGAELFLGRSDHFHRPGR